MISTNHDGAQKSAALLYREAQLTDIPQIFDVRYAVTENVLRNRALVTVADSEDYLTRRGKGWVCEAAGRVVGFAIADLQGHNIWALFVRPEYVGHGVGRRLHALMLAWYFAETSQTVWLSTAPGTRAEEFYHRQGWQKTGLTADGEVRFEMTAREWEKRNVLGWKQAADPQVSFGNGAVAAGL